MEHTAKSFDDEMRSMQKAVTKLAGRVEQQFRRAVRALTESNLSLATEILRQERMIDAEHLAASDMCSELLAKRQPLALDLRIVMAAIHSINDLERIGDESRKIALRSSSLMNLSIRDHLPLTEILALSESAGNMLRSAIDAMVREDNHMFARLSVQDNEIDKKRDQLQALLIKLASTFPQDTSAFVDAIFVVQSVERVADHARNIAAYVVGVVEGVDVRHSDQHHQA
ncbi:MAG: phosphate transport system regulatory protein PhoU [Betaproteobacteria bacterium]|jgi:phosphate transport system protein|nr:phosphate signaling complex protein PhoU [Pseudomonadota bacterium]NBO03623.1 phosphate transport system regulatory protein PhoU [Betaproteobacteria bacterium]NBO95476.1 phosphate transport system regulatory protein PhoU [Betaproteobacteria bacterium]NCW81772.1 phosphate transport system regulatory protein PhoU [Betaproteobacteria bacterium]NDE93549.1 phosphate transport system regulatory protein PhoU [Betaproteobacteria bacterium]